MCVLSPHPACLQRAWLQTATGSILSTHGTREPTFSIPLNSRNKTSASKRQQCGTKATQGKDNDKAGSSRGFGSHLKPDSAKLSPLGYELHYCSSGGSRGLCFLHQAPKPGGVSLRHDYLLQEGKYFFPQRLLVSKRGCFRKARKKLPR